MNWNNLELPDNPYYSDDAVIIYHGDCREILPQLPDNSVDLVLTDPPYGIDLMRGGGYLGKGNKKFPPIIGDNISMDLSFLLDIGSKQMVTIP